MEIQGRGCNGVDLVQNDTGYVSVEGSVEHDNEHSDPIYGEEFLNQLINYQFLKKNSARAFVSRFRYDVESFWSSGQWF